MNDGLVELGGSGLVVPAHLADQQPASATEVARDLDGRRRVVLTHDDFKRVKRAVTMLNGLGFQVVMRCDDTKGRHTNRLEFKPCGGIVNVEVVGQFACECSRMHIAGR